MMGWPSVPDGESPQWTGGDLAIAIGEPGGGTPLFLVHDETGSVEYARSLTRHLSEATTVCALPGSARPEPGLRTVEGMALRLARMVVDIQPRGPYRIAGWSLGGILAYEVAGLLLGRDEAGRAAGFAAAARGIAVPGPANRCQAGQRVRRRLTRPGFRPVREVWTDMRPLSLLGRPEGGRAS